MFFQFDTKIAHLHTTAEFKLLPQVGSFCVIFQFTHRDLEKNTKNAHYLSQQICGQILCVFPIHPLWFGKKHKNCPLSGRGINAFVHGGQFLCDFPAHKIANTNYKNRYKSWKSWKKSHKLTENANKLPIIQVTNWHFNMEITCFSLWF